MQNELKLPTFSHLNYFAMAQNHRLSQGGVVQNTVVFVKNKPLFLIKLQQNETHHSLNLGVFENGVISNSFHHYEAGYKLLESGQFIDSVMQILKKNNPNLFWSQYPKSTEEMAQALVNYIGLAEEAFIMDI